ncbi:MAG: hypothetical protein ABWX67_04005 [Allosphingosinicella sp.]
MSGRIATWMAAALLAGCAGKPEPAPPIAPAAPPEVPQIVIPVPEPPPFEDWRDRALTPGEWTYAAVTGGSEARFGLEGKAARLTMRCDTARRKVLLTRDTAAPVLEVETTFGRRVLAPSTELAADDALLDEIAFSRGRFMVRTMGLPTLTVPAWPEPARVIEDCRG